MQQKGQYEVGLQRPERTGRNDGDQRAADGEKRRAGDLIRRVSADKANGAEQNAMIRSNIDTMIPEWMCAVPQARTNPALMDCTVQRQGVRQDRSKTESKISDCDEHAC